MSSSSSSFASPMETASTTANVSTTRTTRSTSTTTGDTTSNPGTPTASTSSTTPTTALTSTSSSSSTVLPSTQTETTTTQAPRPPPTTETITSNEIGTAVSTQFVSMTDGTVVTTVVAVTRPASPGGPPSTIFETQTTVFQQSSTSTVVSTSSGIDVMGAGATGAQSSGNKDKVGAIIGGVVGGIVGLSLFLTTIVLFRRRRRRNRISASFDGDFDPYRVERAQSQRVQSQSKPPKAQSVAFALPRDKEELPTLPDIPLPVDTPQMTQSRYSSLAPYAPYSPPSSAPSQNEGSSSHHATTEFYGPYSPPHSKSCSPTPILIHPRDDWTHHSPSGPGHGTFASMTVPSDPENLRSHSRMSIGGSSSEHGSSKPLLPSLIPNAASNITYETTNFNAQVHGVHSPTLDAYTRGFGFGSSSSPQPSNEDCSAAERADHRILSRSMSTNAKTVHSPTLDAVSHGFGYVMEDPSDLEDGSGEGSQRSHGGHSGGEGGGNSYCGDRSGSGKRSGVKRLSVTNPDPDVDGDNIAGGSVGGGAGDGERKREDEEQQPGSRPESSYASGDNQKKVVYAGGYDEDARKAYIDSGPVLRRSLVREGCD